ncbi:hypothetical protein, partial [Klebsiella pneumoniae]|uniref:hypothetical protein n=1 Tax=Klebsiella pneumoniae TaxID=573 RepID=UPI001C725E96
MRVTIIGARVAGLATAAEFTDQCHAVTVIAKSGEIGSDSCSWLLAACWHPGARAKVRKNPWCALD